MKLTKVQLALKAIAANMPDETLIHNSRGVLPSVADSLEKSGYIEVEWEGDENSRPAWGMLNSQTRARRTLPGWRDRP